MPFTWVVNTLSLSRTFNIAAYFLILSPVLFVHFRTLMNAAIPMKLPTSAPPALRLRLLWNGVNCESKPYFQLKILHYVKIVTYFRTIIHTPVAQIQQNANLIYFIKIKELIIVITFFNLDWLHCAIIIVIQLWIVDTFNSPIKKRYRGSVFCLKLFGLARPNKDDADDRIN